MGAEFAQVLHPYRNMVQVRFLRAPQQRVFHRKMNPGRFRGTGIHLDHLLRAGQPFRGPLPGQYSFRLRQPVAPAVIPDLGLYFQESESVRYLPGYREYPVRGNMYLRPVQQLHSPVQSGSGIPAGIGLHTGIHIDGNPVFSPVGRQPGQVHIERRVAVMLHRRFAPVDLHRSIHHRPVNLQPDAAFPPLPGNRHIPGIAAQSAGKISHIGPGRRVRRNRRADHPVMGQVHFCPRI